MFSSFTDDDMSPAEDVQPDWRTSSPEYQAFKRFVKLTKTKRGLENQLKEVNSELETMNFQLRDYLGAGGYRNLTIDGYSVFVRRDIFVRAQEGVRSEAVCEALKRHGLAHFVKEQYSVMSLSAHVRALERRHEELTGIKHAPAEDLLPPDLTAVLNCEPKFTVIARRSGDE